MTWFRKQRNEAGPRLGDLPPNRWKITKRNGVWEVRCRYWYYETDLLAYRGADCRRYVDRLQFTAPTLGSALGWIARQPRKVG